MIFRTEIGVRQGGAASPKLFAVYVNKLINKLSHSDEGIRIGNVKIDILLYADDIMAVSFTKIGLQHQLKLIEEYGIEFDVKYNPSKTCYMVYNEKIKRSPEEVKNDQWQQELILCNNKITRVEQMRYLGFQLDHQDKSDKHLTKSKQKAISSIAKLTKIGINSDSISSYMKGQMYKIYIRPILFYGIENVYANKTIVNQLKRIDGNMIKRLFNIPTRCRTTSLLSALNITPVDDLIKNIKLDFFIRLLENEFTKEIVRETSELSTQNDLVNEILNIISDFDDPIVQSQTSLSDKIKAVNYLMNIKRKDEVTIDEKVREIREAFTHKIRCEIPQKLFQILRFDR